MITIRAYRNSDFDLISSWWDQHGEIGPIPGCMVEDGTFVLELDKQPVMSLTVYLTQSKAISYFEGYVSKPGLSKDIRNKAGNLIFNHAFQYAKSHGYQYMVGYCGKTRLTSRYQQLGFTPSISHLTSLFKEI